jgi:DNA-directed RNA polymerase specialized sigma24 family protein
MPATLDPTTAAHPAAATIYLCEIARNAAILAYRRARR